MVKERGFGKDNKGLVSGCAPALVLGSLELDGAAFVNGVCTEGHVFAWSSQAEI